MADSYPYDGRNRYGERNPFETIKELQKAFFGDKEEDKKPLEGVVDAIGTTAGGILETGKAIKRKLPQPVQRKVEETGAVVSTALETLDQIPTPGHPMGPNVGKVDQTAMELGVQTSNLLNVDARAGAVLFLVFNPLDPLGLIADIPKIPKAIKYASKFEDIKDTAKVGTGYLVNKVSSYFSPAQRQVATAGGGPPLPGSIFSQGVDNVNDVNLHQNLFESTTTDARLPRDYTRVERNRIIIEDIAKQNEIIDGWKKVDLRIEANKNTDTALRNVRSTQGTAGLFTQDQVRKFIKSNLDPRIAERLGLAKAYGKRIGEVAYKLKQFPQHLGQQIPKTVNSALKRMEGLVATVEGHHLISNFDSGIIGRLLDNLKDPITKAGIYDYMLNKFKIIPGDFDLNLANIPTNIHRLDGAGKNLHTWLDRMGFEDYWRDFAKLTTGKLTDTVILDGIDQYFDQVFHPMMVKLDELRKQNPLKYDWEGGYIPEYLIEQAKLRLKALQEVNNPALLRGTDQGKDLAREAQIEQAYKAGGGKPGTYQEVIEGITINPREGFGDPSKSKKIQPKVIGPSL